MAFEGKDNLHKQQTYIHVQKLGCKIALKLLNSVRLSETCVTFYL